MKLFALLLMFLAMPAVAQPIDFEALAKQPGTEVIKRTENGRDVVEIRRGGVTVTLRDGEQVGFDNSGYGAIWCTWEISVGATSAADICFPGEFTELSTVLSAQIEALNDFIIANSLTPVTKDDLQARLDDRSRRIRPGSNACAAM